MTECPIEYSISEMMGSPELLSISVDGQARFASHTNISTRGAHPVGTFAASIPAAQMASIKSALTTPPFDDLPDHWGLIKSGQLYKAIRLTRASGVVEKRIVSNQPLAPPTRALFDLMDRIVRDIRHHPVENLQLVLSGASISPAGQFLALATISNPGTVPTKYRNPALPGAGMRLVLRAYPNRVPETINSLDVLETAVVTLRSTSGNAGAASLLELRPKSSAAFEVRAHLPVPATTPHLVQLLYQNTKTEIDGHKVLDIELYTPPARITV